VVAEPFNVPSASMIPTLLVGDTLIAGKYTYGLSKYSAPFGLMPNFEGRILNQPPKRGDVLVFKLPRDPSINYVKRLIGLPGDKLQMREGRLYINGEIVPRTVKETAEFDLRGRNVTRYDETLPGGVIHAIYEQSDDALYDSTREFTVPDNSYFMMGDNRDDSLDSRVSAEGGGVGFVAPEYLVGRVDRIMYSRDVDVGLWPVGALLESFRPQRFLAAVR
jgi:signal peptidase I